MGLQSNCGPTLPHKTLIKIIHFKEVEFVCQIFLDFYFNYLFVQGFFIPITVLFENFNKTYFQIVFRNFRSEILQLIRNLGAEFLFLIFFDFSTFCYSTIFNTQIKSSSVYIEESTDVLAYFFNCFLIQGIFPFLEFVLMVFTKLNQTLVDIKLFRSHCQLQMSQLWFLTI